MESIPPHLCRDSGPTAKRLDLSYNRLKFVAVCLECIVLHVARSQLMNEDWFNLVLNRLPTNG